MGALLEALGAGAGVAGGLGTNDVVVGIPLPANGSGPYGQVWGGPSASDDPEDYLDDCNRAAIRTTGDWEAFCRGLPANWKRIRSGCWSHSHDSSTQKKNWCFSQFGDDPPPPGVVAGPQGVVVGPARY